MAEERQPEEASDLQEETITRPTRGIPFRRSPEFRVIYSNSVRFATAPWDFSFVFGQTIVDILDDLHIEDRVIITLSPQTAKSMAVILNQNLETYERQYGEIRYTPIPQSSPEPSA